MAEEKLPAFLDLYHPEQLLDKELGLGAHGVLDETEPLISTDGRLALGELVCHLEHLLSVLLIPHLVELLHYIQLTGIVENLVKPAS